MIIEHEKGTTAPARAAAASAGLSRTRRSRVKTISVVRSLPTLIV